MPALWAFLLFSGGVWLWGKVGGWSFLSLCLLPLSVWRPKFLYGGFLVLGVLAAFLASRKFPDRLKVQGRRVLLLEPLDTARARVVGLWEDGRAFRASGIVFTRGRWLSPRERYWVAGFVKGDTVFYRRWVRAERFGFLRPAREYIRKVVERGAPSPEAEGLALAFLLGDRSRIPPEVKAAFRETGMMHLLAISGLHIGVLFGAFALLLAWLGKGRALAGALALTWVYALVAGANPPVIRASLAATAFVLAYLSGRGAEPLNALGAAGLLSLAINPAWLHSLSFQMSYLATAGILLHARVPAKGKVKPLAQGLAATAGAQLWVLPLLLNNFGAFSGWVFLLNFVAVPILAAALGAWVLALIAGAVPPLSLAYGKAAGELTHLMACLVQGAADLAPLRFSAPFPDWLVPFWYGALAVLGALQRKVRW